MEIVSMWKNSHMIFKASMRWYFGRYFKRHISQNSNASTFSHLPDLQQRVTWHGVVILKGGDWDIFEKITSVLDLKLQRTAAAYEDLQAEMWDRGFQKELRNTGKLSNRAIWWREKKKKKTLQKLWEFSDSECSWCSRNKPTKNSEPPPPCFSEWFNARGENTFLCSITSVGGNTVTAFQKMPLKGQYVISFRH